MLALKAYRVHTKIVLKLFKAFRLLFALSTMLFYGTIVAFAQSDTLAAASTDTVILVTDSLQTDSLGHINDSTTADTLVKKKPEKFLEDKVIYDATDSMRLSVNGKRLYLYGQASVTYLDIKLQADYIEFDMGNQVVFARGAFDTSGVMAGMPIFTQGSEEFESDSLKYSFRSGEGIIYEVATKQDEGYLLSQKTKRASDGHIHVQGGKYTTCDAEHPHFYMHLTKAIVIPDDKIITGPAYLVIEDIPTPLFLPFGFFPNTSSRASGIIIPRYGEEQTRGFYLSQGGWYQVLGDYADLTVLGAIYSKGSWNLSNSINYRLRYKFSGNLRFNYAINKNNDDPAFAVSKDFRVIWSHMQDAKANPTQTFSANVNYSSSEYDQKNSYNYSNYLTNQKSSSINFTKNWPGTPFNLSLSALASQSTINQKTKIDLPTGSFNATRIYPFKALSKSGKSRWYDDIGFSYSSKFSNNIDVKDSLVFRAETWEKSNFGFQHNVPLFINIKTGKLFNISPSLSYQGRLYNFYTNKYVEHFGSLANPSDTVRTDTIYNFTYIHAINPSIGFSFTPKVYGMYTNKRPNARLVAVRHVMTPNASFSYVPDMRSINANYYDTLYYYQNGQQKREVYSHYEDNMYGTPSSNGQSGSVRLSLSNNLEAKMFAKNDTTGEPVKVPIIENLNISTSYNPFADHFKWSDVSMRGATNLFKKKLNLSVNSNFSLYDLDSLGNRIDQFIWKENAQYLRMTRLGVTMNYALSSGQGSQGGNSSQASSDPIKPMIGDQYSDEYDQMDFVPGQYSTDYVDFEVPWSVRFAYNWSWSKNGLKVRRTHTLGVSGDISLTPKWKIGANTNYDLEEREFSFTNISINRDLHCWMMQFTMVPFGPRRSYTFTINAKSALLRDLKYDKRNSWYDNF